MSMLEDFIPKMHGISFPVIASAIFLVFISPGSYILAMVRNNLRVYAAIMVPWMLLILLTLWAVALAEDALTKLKTKHL